MRVVCVRAPLLLSASCFHDNQTHHPGWQEVVWDEAAVLDLIQSDFPWFLRTYLSYPRLVQRSDVMRYMVLYKYGGVYLDADVSIACVVTQGGAGGERTPGCGAP